MNLIPLASLAAILIQVGFKLNKIDIYKNAFKSGIYQYAPFLITIASILFTDLLTGIIIGIIVGLIFVIYSNFKKGIQTTNIDENYIIKFTRNQYFFHKSGVSRALRDIPSGANVLIDGTKIDFIDYDIQGLMCNFLDTAESKEINVTLKKSSSAKLSMFQKQNVITKNQKNEII